MDQVASPFFLGFLTGGLVGWIATFIRGSWTRIEKTRKQMFLTPPQPAFRPLPTEKGVSVLSTIPDKSPIDVLFSGCLSIFFQLIIQIGLVIGAGFIFWFFSTEEVPPGFFSGVFFAAIFGFLLTNLHYNFKKVTVLYKLITNPPVAALNPEKPPNKQFIAARPTLPPCQVVVESLFEIFLRLTWMLVLVAMLVLSILMVADYLRGVEFQLPLT